MRRWEGRWLIGILMISSVARWAEMPLSWPSAADGNRTPQVMRAISGYVGHVDRFAQLAFPSTRGRLVTFGISELGRRPKRHS